MIVLARFFSFFALASAAVSAGCAPGSVRHSAPARIDSRIWRDARRADALGLTPAATLSTAFGSIADVSRALSEGEPDRSPVPGSSTGAASGSLGGRGAGADLRTGDQEWFASVLERHRFEVDDAWDATDTRSTFVGFAEDPRLRFVYVDQTMKFYNEQGRQFTEGANLFVSSRMVGRLANRLVLTADPELYFNENRNVELDGSDEGVRMQELTLSGRLGPAELTVGRTPLWWGPSRHGALLLSNNAQPLDLIRLSTAGPLLLPGPLAHLGLIRAEVFASQLEDERPVPRPYLAGARVTTRLLPWLELGASRTAMFGGKGRNVDPGTIWNVITARTENDETGDPGNQLASIDGRLIVPWELQPFELYGEYGGEDEAGGFFSRTAYVAGVYLPRVGPWRALELTVEAANTTVPGHARVWYTSRNFPEGYTYKEQIIGHHMGTDALDIFAEVRVHAREDVVVFTSFDYEEHFREDPVEEKLYQARVGVEWRAWQELWIAGFYAFDAWHDFQQRNGDRETGQAAGVALKWDWGSVPRGR